MIQRLGQRTLSGVGVTVLGTLATSGSGLLAQIVLGLYLAKEDFAWYAIALSWSAFAIALRNGGTEQILIRSGPRFMELAPPVLRISFWVNGGLFAGLIILAIAVSSYHRNGFIALLMICIGLYIPLGTYSPIFQARLANESRFTTLAKVNLASAVVRALSAIIFAIAGLGAASLALPFLLVAICEFVMGKRATALALRSRSPTAAERTEIFSQARWIALGSMSVALVMYGDYLAIGMFGSAHALADYFFGFQLTAAVASLLTNGIQTVMLPTFVALTNDPERQIQAFSRTTVTLMIVSIGGCFLVALVAAPLIHLLWNGKWDNAIIVVQLMAVTLPLRLLMPLGRALLESRGLWRITAPLALLDGLGIFLAAAIGAWLGSLADIAVSVALYRILSSLLHYCITRSRIRVLSLRDMWRQVLMPLGCGAGALGAAVCSRNLVGEGALALTASVVTFGVVYLGASLLLYRADCIYLIEVARATRAGYR
jgi:O-antigen/teichoic acid export membrane protein